MLEKQMRNEMKNSLFRAPCDREGDDSMHLRCEGSPDVDSRQKHGDAGSAGDLGLNSTESSAAGTRAKSQKFQSTKGKRTPSAISFNLSSQ